MGGYISPQKITDELTIVASEEECSLHINCSPRANDIDCFADGTKIFRLTTEEWKLLFWVWSRELPENERITLAHELLSDEEHE